MSRIVPKLNLNKTPQLVENNSLIMAKNIRLLEDGTIGPDTSLKEIETHTGNSVQHVIHHNEITQQVVTHQYTVLEYSAAVDVTKNSTVLDDNDLERSAYDFEDYHPVSSDANNGTLDKSNTASQTYIKQDSDVPCTIYCYKYDTLGKTGWVYKQFNYDVNNNRLTDVGGYCLFIAVRSDIYNGTSSQSNATEYYYIALPNSTLLSTINIGGTDYKVINSVYDTISENTVVVQEAYDEYYNSYDTIKYVGQIVGLDSKIYFFKESYYIQDSTVARDRIALAYPNEDFVGAATRSSVVQTFDVDENGYITRNGELFQDPDIAVYITPEFNDRVKIFEFDEITETFSIVNCAWTYSGGEINGCVSVNSTGEYILTISEYNVPNNKLVPIKHINLTRCSNNDDETFYTQAPNIPITNLKLAGKYIKTIPAGVYQFFIRYKIRDEFYTPWFPCSKELFAGTRKEIRTLQGGIKYTDLHEDSNESFIFTVEHLFAQYLNNFEQYQLGFIVSSDDGMFARSWKHFDINSNDLEEIHFEYNKEDIQEINIDDLLSVNYDIFNAKNIALYKNKLYITNYEETDFNEDLNSYASNINIKLKLRKFDTAQTYYFNNIPLEESSSFSGIYNVYGGNLVSNTFAHNSFCITTRETSTTSTSLGVMTEDEYNALHAHIVRGWVDGTPDYYLIGSSNEDAGIIISNISKGAIAYLIGEIRNLLVGIDTNGVYKILKSPSYVDAITYTVVYRTYVRNSITSEVVAIDHSITETNQLKPNVLTSSYKYNEFNTLLPFTKYEFYIHFVKQNGIVTNGYYIDSKEIQRYCQGYKQLSTTPGSYTTVTNIDNIDDISTYYSTSPTNIKYQNTYYGISEIDTNNNYIIYPTFSNIKCPPGYVGCFISINKCSNNVAQCFNFETTSENNETLYKADCLELDTLLYNSQNDITVKNSKGVILATDATYFSSSSTNPVKHLGCSGHIEFRSSETIIQPVFVIFSSNNVTADKSLIKLTPYINLKNSSTTSYDNYIDVNSPGYLCEVKKLNRHYCDFGYFDGQSRPTGYYVSGNDVYTRTRNGGNDNDITLNEITAKLDYNTSPYGYVFSNFNLNYISLQEDPQTIVRTYEVSENANGHQFLTVVNSLTCSFIYTLASMYRDYTRKLYNEYTTNKITKFDNTIRSSSIDVDEIYRYIYRFEATDYYNVPTNRGIITNLISIVNSIYVHCEHSLFKFTDNKTLNAQNENVTLQENDIFNSGITEVFDAQYGYAGLKKREQSLVTYNAYIFYDEVTKTIYAFGGEQQIGNISESIKKLINFVNPTDVKFVADELNNRFFVNLINNNGNVCLSFNFAAKSFVSIHDINFRFGFHSRRHTYLVHDNKYGSDIIGWSLYKIVDNIKTQYTLNSPQSGDYPGTSSKGFNGTTPVYYKDNYSAYQNCYEVSLVSIYDCDYDIILNEVNAANSCVDIIINIEYEKIKALNYINWICSEIIEYGDHQNLVAEENTNKQYPGTKLRIYSDSTSTDIIGLLDDNGNAKISNNERNIDISGNISANPNSWQYIRYNCGVWSMNYFRDIMNNKDVFDYKDPSNKITGGVGHSTTTDLTPKKPRLSLTQENSLIYGKYFVVRFIFNNKNFKLENVTLRMNDYDKAK